jgi:hypothetical protein
LENLSESIFPCEDFDFYEGGGGGILDRLMVGGGGGGGGTGLKMTLRLGLIFDLKTGG